MPSIKDLKKRIGSVKNTQQTTKAMKMVSAAKLRRAQEAIQSQRPYARGIQGLMTRMAATPEAQSYLTGSSAEEGLEKRLLLVVVTSDRGLCGGFNSNIIRLTQKWVSQNKNKYSQVDLSFVGKKAFDFFKTKNYTLGPSLLDFGGKVSFVKAKGLGKQLVGLFESGKYTEIKFIYNEFKNAATQKAEIESYLPLNAAQLKGQGSTDGDSGEMLIVRPDFSILVPELLNKHFIVQAHRILLESQAGEHGARMSSMESATKNAGEMIKKLTLQYNKQRQAGITKELLEIIAGSESQKQ